VTRIDKILADQALAAVAERPTDECLSQLRASWLRLQGMDAIEIHGWLLGVACAVERKNGHDPKKSDALIAELRASKGPPL
jgi:hypothetical protein